MNLFIQAVVRFDAERLLVRLRVANGGRIPTAEQIAHLFEPFFTVGEGGAGLGLGLWVTYQIVQQLGGRIVATTEEEEMHFIVEIPLEAAP